MNFELKTYLKEKQNLINQKLDFYMPKEDEFPKEIIDAMRYSVFAGGKRLRPILAIAASETVAGKISEDVLKVACALEFIHTYSLIHDDLPAMDNDDLRRGKPTCHKVFGEAIAILAGDGLLTYSFELLSNLDTKNLRKDNMNRYLKVINIISHCAGYNGMIGGQVVDILYENKNEKLSKEILNYIHEHKTGALFQAALKAGAIIAGANSQQLNNLAKYGHYFGLAFQIIDDILDIEGNVEDLGKPVGSDQKNEKATFPAIYGLEESKVMAAESVEKAIESLDSFGEKAQPLISLANYVLSRKN